jgi:hypothetical protein
MQNGVLLIFLAVPGSPLRRLVGGVPWFEFFKLSLLRLAQ